jgi:DNA-binding SARP family transcriptional activator
VGVSGTVEYGVLGPVEITVAGRAVDVGGPRQRLLLATLLAARDQVVSIAALVDGLWETDPPPDARRTVQAYVSRLRGTLALGPAGRHVLVTQPPGYALRPGPEAVDALRFESLAAAGRRALAEGRAAAASGALRQALDLWRGDAYAGLTGTPMLNAEASRLEHARLLALTDRFEADLGAGQGPGLVADLEGLVLRHPDHERLWAHLMVALYRAGRHSDAAAAFGRAREILIERYGLEPSPALVEVHRRVLAHDPRLRPTPDQPAQPKPGSPSGSPLGSPQPATTPAPDAVPAQLPGTVAAFAGRRGELAALDGLLPGGRPADRSNPLAVLSGPAGVGKTALALHWAHRVTEHFPAGQLYVDLRGFHPSGHQVDPGQALRGFLAALGVPARQVPPDADAQAALYRSRLAGKRMLIVLDNARDAAQVRPLLPGTPTAAVLITSRSQLTGLVVTHSAVALRLALPSRDEAYALLAGRLGPARVGAERAAADRIIASCARLPLALAVAAARLAQTGFTLAAVADELTRPGARLDALATGDAESGVEAVFATSYGALREPAARLFWMIGLLPHADVSGAALISLAGEDAATTRAAVSELVATGLLTEHAPGRYGHHDLLAEYAGRLAGQADPASRRAALRRLLDHFLHTGHAAARLMNPARDPVRPPLVPPAPGVAAERLAGRADAERWLTAEHDLIQGLLRLAAAERYDKHVVQLAWCLWTLLDRSGRWHDVVIAARQSIAAADRLGDRRAAGSARCMLAWVSVQLGDDEAVWSALAGAEDDYLAAGDAAGQARVRYEMARTMALRDRPGEALPHAMACLELFRAAGARRGEADTLNVISWCEAELGNPAEAVRYGKEALGLFRADGDRYGEAHVRDTIGHAHQLLGEHAAAVAHFEDAARLLGEASDRYWQAGAYRKLGDSRNALGDRPAADAAWLSALVILTELNHPEADKVRELLNQAVIVR